MLVSVNYAILEKCRRKASPFFFKFDNKKNKQTNKQTKQTKRRHHDNYATLTSKWQKNLPYLQLEILLVHDLS